MLQTSKGISLSAVIPAYNEEESIRHAINTTVKTFTHVGIDWEIIVVNDGSTDNTKILSEELANHPDIQLISHEKNRGIGAAFRTGVSSSSKEFVILIPADNPLSPEELETYIPRMRQCDIIVGVRSERVGYSWFSRACSFIYNRLLIPLLFNVGISDVNWIQVYRREIFTNGGITIEHDGIFFLVEMLVKGKKNRLVIAEIPATMKRRLSGQATVTNFAVIWHTLIDALYFFFRFR